MTESKPLLVAGADGFGEALKDSLVEHCRARGYEVDDLGTGAYYDKAGEVARRVQVDGAKGLLFCGTGMGVGIVANRFSGIQAATCENVAAARCARAINDSNVLCLGGKVTTPADARAICDAWLAAWNQISGARRHRRDNLTHWLISTGGSRRSTASLRATRRRSGGPATSRPSWRTSGRLCTRSRANRGSTDRVDGAQHCTSAPYQ